MVPGKRAATALVSRAEFEALRAQVEALASRYGARDAAETAVLSAIAVAIGSRWFTSVELMAHSHVDGGLAAAFEAADITTVRECGKLLARLAVQSIDGLTLRRVGTSRAGVIWSVQVSNSQTRTAAD